jgi:hypothetical protein
MPLLSWPAADSLVRWLCPWTVADSALAAAARAMTLHPVAVHCACCCDRLCLYSLSRLWGGRDQMPLAVDLLQASQQEAPQAPAFFDLAVHRLHDRLALGVDRGSLLASELAGHAGPGVGISGQRTSLRRRWLPVRQTAGGDVGINAVGLALACVVLTTIARIQRHHLRQCTGASRNALQHEFKVLDIRRLVAHCHRHDHLVVAVHRYLAVVALQVRPA